MPGAPVEEFGRFTAEVRCPECAYTLPAGVHVLHGSKEAAHWVKKAPFLARAWAWMVNGDGCGAVMLHIFTAMLLSVSVLAVLELARGEVSALGMDDWISIGAAALCTHAVARFWWQFRLVASDGSLRADQVALCTIVAPDRVWLVGRADPLHGVRSLRVIEHIDADDDEVVASLLIDAPSERASLGEPSSPVPPIFMPLPRLSAHRVSAQLMATFRGRADGVRWDVPSTIEGIDATPIKGSSMVMPVIALGCVLMLAVPVLLRSLAVLVPAAPMVLLIALVTFGAAVILTAAKSRPPMKRTMWVVGEEGVAVMRPSQRRMEAGGARRGLVPRARLKRLEVRRERGLPYLELVGAGSLFLACTNAPDDWGGLSPEEYAEKLSAQLGIPWSAA